MEDKVLQTVVDKLGYAFTKDVLVKPLAPVMVTKEVSEPIPTGEVDDDGFNKYEVETEVKEVEAMWRKGLVLALPIDMKCPYEVGDTVVFNRNLGAEFDLFKDSLLIKPYDIIAVVKA